MDKIQFWKKKESSGPDLGLPPSSSEGPNLGMNNNQLGLNTGNSPEHDMGDFSTPHSIPSMQDSPSSPPSLAGYPSHQQQQSSQRSDKDLEVISAKLDAIRASLESINQRLGALENIARQSNSDDHNQYRW